MIGPENALLEPLPIGQEGERPEGLAVSAEYGTVASPEIRCWAVEPFGVCAGAADVAVSLVGGRLWEALGRGWWRESEDAEFLGDEVELVEGLVGAEREFGEV